MLIHADFVNAQNNEYDFCIRKMYSTTVVVAWWVAGSSRISNSIGMCTHSQHIIIHSRNFVELKEPVALNSIT